MVVFHIDNTTLEQLHAFDHLDATHKHLNVQDKDMWNMDETGIVLGICANTLVLTSSEKSHTYVKAPHEVATARRDQEGDHDCRLHV